MTRIRPELGLSAGSDPHDRPVPLADPHLEPLSGDGRGQGRNRVRDPDAVDGDRAALHEAAGLSARRREAGLREQHDGPGRRDLGRHGGAARGREDRCQQGRIADRLTLEQRLRDCDGLPGRGLAVDPGGHVEGQPPLGPARLGRSRHGRVERLDLLARPMS